ncbi:putative oxidoreductase CipA [Melanomma pulvis-pyrius CBS 109.77]|uniref:Putative oxidoreductase CipA n=1 Tax=Melanomma pulvis-pyrius CBS 109.77 TaxID=1314802 RepID=A0A6A6WYW6_9PLEO|nr:putative oxidoreductase CipA [Melanomma pulvis-pyrius CBS 109.77]
MAQTNHIEKVAIVGVSGNLGKHFTEELLETGRHVVTALTRPGSKAILPAGVKVAQVDYDDEEVLVSALKGQQFLVITLSVLAPPDTHSKIVKAAVKAGVPYIMPNVYGWDIFNKTLREDTPHGPATLEKTLEIETLGSAYIAMVCGFWFEWSVALSPDSFGFDIRNKKVTFYDDGKTRINVSTWRQCGRALSALLSLPEDGASPALSQWKNKPLYIDSFAVSQRDILDSIHRVAGTSDDDWEISFEPSSERYRNGMDEMQKGARSGFVKAMYARVFFPGGGGAFEPAQGLANDVLGLPKEDLDEATRRAVDMAEGGWNPFAQ